MVKRHQRPNPARPNAQVGVIEKEGPIHISNVAIVDPKDKKPTRVGIRRDGRQAHARHQALRSGAGLTWHDSRTSTTSRSGRRWCASSATAPPMQAPKLQKVTLNMGVGEAKQDSKMLEAAQEQLGDDRRPEAEHPPRPQVRRRVQAARGHAGRPVGHAARRARVRVPRPPHVDRAAAPARLPRAQPALVRRARQLLDGDPRAGHLPGDRLRQHRPGARARHHHHDIRPDRRRGVRAARRARAALRSRRAPGRLREPCRASRSAA